MESLIPSRRSHLNITPSPPSVSPDFRPRDFPTWMSNTEDPFGRDDFVPGVPFAPSTQRSPSVCQGLQMTGSVRRSATERRGRLSDSRRLAVVTPTSNGLRASSSSTSEFARSASSGSSAFVSSEETLNVLNSFPEPPSHIPTKRRRSRPLSLDGGVPFPSRALLPLNRQDSTAGMRTSNVLQTPFSPFEDAVENMLIDTTSAECMGVKAAMCEGLSAGKCDEGRAEVEPVPASPTIEPLAPMKLKGFCGPGRPPQRPPRNRPFSLFSSLYTPPSHSSIVDTHHRPVVDEPSERSTTCAERSQSSQADDSRHSSPPETASKAHVTDTRAPPVLQEGAPLVVSPVQEVPSCPQADVTLTITEGEETSRPGRSNSIRKVMGKFRKLTSAKKKIGILHRSSD
ncbi:hypothetical protein DFH11DRAFT_281328 [Phellopilus nigrolimitatus]|nr:hypothetical protein DFH11DRAFT_281328 [Phellopilus nigrolimitatus]